MELAIRTDQNPGPKLGLIPVSKKDLGTIPFLVEKEAHFALRVVGDSMEPTLRAGDIVACVFARTRQPVHGDMVIANIDGGICVKWLLQNRCGQWFLRSENPKYQDRYLTDGNRISAVVIGSLRRGAPMYPGA